MLRFVVMLSSDKQDAEDVSHYFSTFREAEEFAIKNRFRFVDCFSEEKKVVGETESWRWHATYNIFADPNKQE